jgi:hypothetical protein
MCKKCEQLAHVSRQPVGVFRDDGANLPGSTIGNQPLQLGPV